MCGKFGGLDLLLNVILFVPLGVGLGLAATPRGKALSLIVGLTVMVELAQYRMLPGREGTVSDVLMNTLGGALGIRLGRNLAGLLFPTPRSARVLAGVAAAVWAAVCVTTAVGLQRSLPSGSYDLEWAPARAPLQAYPGRVRSVAINGNPTQRRMVIPSALVAGGDSVRIEASVTVNRPPVLTAPIALIVRGRDEIAMLGQRVHTIVFSLRVRATDWRLKTPYVVLDDALAPGGEPIAEAMAVPARVVGMRQRQTVAVEAEHGGLTRAWSVDLAPTLGWVLVLPFDYSLRQGYRTGSALWIAALIAPLGYWSAAAGRQSRRANVVTWGIPLASIAGVLGLVPPAFGYGRSHWSEWAAAGVGLLVGWALFAAANRFRTTRAE
jgi:hypothetical protein